MREPDGNIAGLHPILRAAAERRRLGPQYAELSIAAARALGRERLGSPASMPALFAVDALSIPGAVGMIAARLYRPSPAPLLPMIVYFHGGGFVCGGLDSHDTLLRQLAMSCGALVLSVDYRLAPEHPFPAAVDDGAAVLNYLRTHAGALHTRADLIFAGGDSAGAAIAFGAAGTTMTTAGLLLFYPVADLTDIGHRPSHIAFGDGRAGLSTDDANWSADNYAPNHADRSDWRCSPLHFDGSVQLPPVFIATAEFDILRSEGEQLAAHLNTLGISVCHHRAEGMAHGYLGVGGLVGETQQTLTAAAAWLRPNLVGPK